MTFSEIRRHAAGQHREFAKQIVPLEPAFGQSMQACIIRPLTAGELAQQLEQLIRQAVPYVDRKRLVDVLHDDAAVSALRFSAGRGDEPRPAPGVTVCLPSGPATATANADPDRSHRHAPRIYECIAIASKAWATIITDTP